MTMSKSNNCVSKGFAVIVSAVLLVASCAFSAWIVSGPDPTQTAADNAKQAITKYADSTVRLNADYTDNIFKKAQSASMMFTGKNDDGQLEQIASAVGAETVFVTNEKGKIIEVYPSDSKEKGKTIKGDKELGQFNRLLRGISVKSISDPVKNEDDTYSVKAGVMRSDAEGVVIVGITDESYAEAAGVNTADLCGANTAVEKDGAIISTNISGASDKSSIKDLTGSDSDSGKMTADGKDYNYRVVKAEDYTVLAATPSQGFIMDNKLVSVIVVNVVLILIGACLFVVGSKKK